MRVPTKETDFTTEKDPYPVTGLSWLTKPTINSENEEE